MPEIIINSCSKTPNYCALEAIAKYMRLNYVNRTPKREHLIKVESGRVIKVSEQEHNDEKSICSCTFDVERVDV